MTISHKTTRLSRSDSSGERSLSPLGLWKLAGISILIFALLFSILLVIFTGFQQKSRLGVVSTLDIPSWSGAGQSFGQIPGSHPSENRSSSGRTIPVDSDVSAWKVAYTPMTTVILLPNQGTVPLAGLLQH